MIRKIKNIINHNKLLRSLVVPVYKIFFFSSSDYWESRYKSGGNSGTGSYGKFAKFKAEIINDFVKKNKIKNIIELGCGDGANLQLYEIESYLGYDVSPTIIKTNKKQFQNKNFQFDLMKNLDIKIKTELSISLDVIYHLTEDKVYKNYMETLFKISSKYVIIYSSNFDDIDVVNAHVRHRNFEREIPKTFELQTHIPNRFPPESCEVFSLADFFVYKRLN